MSSDDLDEPVLGGVHLRQHAGVAAALGDGLPLDDVLKQEQIDKAAWPTADACWMEALADSPDLQMRYMRRRRQAEDALARPIAPLDDDPAAWAGLLGALNATDDPQALLDGLGLRMTDIGRLGRHWKRKAEADPKVVEALTEAAGNSAAPAEVTAQPMVLRTFPWSPGAKPSAPPPLGQSAEAPVPSGSSETKRLSETRQGRLVIELEADLFAAMLAVKQVAPEASNAALALCGLDEARFEGVERAWERGMASNPNLRAEVSIRVADHRDALRHLLAGARPIIRSTDGA